MRKSIVVILSLVNLIYAQLYEKPSINFGLGLGAGGNHFILKPSIDVFYGKFDLALAPFLDYFSVGLRYKFGRYHYCNKLTPHFPNIYIGYSYHHSWLLGKKMFFNRDVSKVQLHTIIVGLHKDLDYRRIIFIEGGIGGSYAKRYFPTLNGWRDAFYPAFEIRMVGVFQSRKIKQQKLKKYMPRELPIVEEEEQLSKKEQRQKRKEEKRKLKELEKQYRKEVKEEAKREKQRDKEEIKRFKQQLKAEKKKLKEELKNKKKKKKGKDNNENKEPNPESQEE